MLLLIKRQAEDSSFYRNLKITATQNPSSSTKNTDRQIKSGAAEWTVFQLSWIRRSLSICAFCKQLLEIQMFCLISENKIILWINCKQTTHLLHYAGRRKQETATPKNISNSRSSYASGTCTHAKENFFVEERHYSSNWGFGGELIENVAESDYVGSALLRSERPERHVRKASHCGSKQQQSSRAAITLLFLVRATYMYGVVLRAHPVRGESHIQRNATGKVATAGVIQRANVYAISKECTHQKLPTGVVVFSLPHFIFRNISKIPILSQQSNLLKSSGGGRTTLSSFDATKRAGAAIFGLAASRCSFFNCGGTACLRWQSYKGKLHRNIQNQRSPSFPAPGVNLSDWQQFRYGGNKLC